MRRIWAIDHYPPVAADLTAAKNAGANEVMSLPCPALPQLVAGLNTVAEPGDTLPEQVAQALAKLAKARSDAIERFHVNVGGADYPIPITTQTQLDIGTAVQALGLQPPGTTIPWEIADGTYTPLGLAQLQAIGSAAFAWVQACYARSQALAGQIQASQTPLAVDLTQGWPT